MSNYPKGANDKPRAEHTVGGWYVFSQCLEDGSEYAKGVMAVSDKTETKVAVDIFNHKDAELIASAPTLRRKLNEANTALFKAGELCADTCSELDNALRQRDDLLKACEYALTTIKETVDKWGVLFPDLYAKLDQAIKNCEVTNERS